MDAKTTTTLVFATFLCVVNFATGEITDSLILSSNGRSKSDYKPLLCNEDRHCNRPCEEEGSRPLGCCAESRDGSGNKFCLCCPAESQCVLGMGATSYIYNSDCKLMCYSQTYNYGKLIEFSPNMCGP